MGLLKNRTKAPKPPKMACPSCGKPNLVPAPGEAVRCILCHSVLPVTDAFAGRGIEVPAAFGGTPDLAPSAASWDEVPATPEPVSAPPVVVEEVVVHGDEWSPVGEVSARDVTERSPLRDVVIEDYVPFDLNGLDLGEPALPRPSAMD
jgi:hypothetical protein